MAAAQQKYGQNLQRTDTKITISRKLFQYSDQQNGIKNNCSTDVDNLHYIGLARLVFHNLNQLPQKMRKKKSKLI